jgi:hypothetical protein
MKSEHLDEARFVRTREVPLPRRGNKRAFQLPDPVLS